MESHTHGSEDGQKWHPIEESPARVGAVDHPNAAKIRVVHISDTHGTHDDPSLVIPHGDILIHSGDFSAWGSYDTYDEFISKINTFFGQQPHKVKIFVAGNHERPLAEKTRGEIEKAITGAVYLQDSGLDVNGIRIHGSPWTDAGPLSSFISRDLKDYWSQIPSSTDILVTHMPPHGVLDVAQPSQDADDTEDSDPWWQGTCSTCGKVHPGQIHRGCPDLRSTVLNRVRPTLHLFGHIHEGTGALTEDGVLFCNGAVFENPTPIVVDYYLLPGEHSKPKRCCLCTNRNN